MQRKRTAIQRKLMRIFILTSSLILLITCTVFTVYEYISYRQASREQLSTIGKIIAANSTAALAFDSEQDANEILHALRTEEHIVAACLYDEEGKVFTRYPLSLPLDQLPPRPLANGYRYVNGYLEGFQPVAERSVFLGTLYLRSDMEAINQRLTLYLLITMLVITGSLLAAYLLSRRLQKKITNPILHLASATRAVSNSQDYSIRASRVSTDNDELSELTDAFNGMLAQIEQQNERITSFNQDLEEKIKLRTAELESANNELAVVNSKLVKSNRELEQFAYIASHDMQEPLRKIQTFSELAGRNADSNEQTIKYIDKIRSSAARMSSLIKAILNYSRLSVLDDQGAPVDLNQVVHNVITDFELLLEEKNGIISYDSLPVVRGNSLQLQQLFFNLVSNALKFSAKDPIIKISARTVDADAAGVAVSERISGKYTEIRFEDNGIGFDQVYADKVFAIFQRLHDKQEYPGTGIGLALCKRIVENHHGLIKVKSIQGEGTIFFIYLPI